MNIDSGAGDFMNNPDKISFVTRLTDDVSRFAKDNPDMIVSQTLLDEFIVGYIDRNYINEFSHSFGINQVSMYPFVVGLLDHDSLNISGIPSVHESSNMNLKGKGTIVGIIDTGIDYTSRAFIDSEGNSRIQFVFDQSGAGPPPEGFLFGTEYTNKQINEAIRSEDPYALIPEQDTVEHGTFLASVAAGSDAAENIGAAPEAELIVVKLKDASAYYREMYLVPPNQKNAYESIDVMIGVEYILKKAQTLNKPVSICLGIGTNQGGHDGFSLFEEYLSRIANISGVCLTTAVGNESQASHHYHGELLKTGDSLDIDIKVGEDAGNIYVSIWNNAVDRISVSVKSPMGETVGGVTAKPGVLLSSRMLLEKSTVTIKYSFPADGNGGQMTVVKILDATPGIWTIAVFGDIILGGSVHAWLPIVGFVSPNVEFLSADPHYTIVVPATSPSVIACGAYDKAGIIYTYSSWGPSRLPGMRPDLVSPGVDVGGIYPGGYGRMSGTSVAAAITAGAAALMLQWGIVERHDPFMGTYGVKAYMIRGCSRDSGTDYPNTKWGYGRLNLARSFNLMLGQ